MSRPSYVIADQQFLLPCAVCSRTFRPEALVRHEKVCEKTLSKKRNVFNSFKSRVAGTELEEFLGPLPLASQPQKPQKPKPVPKKAPKWRQTHEALVATLRAARGDAVPSSSAPAATLNLSDNEQCPTCGRHFGPRAFDRHVAFCREVMSRKPKTPAKNPAQQRMEARIKYRAPLLLKKSRQKDAPEMQPVPLTRIAAKTHRVDSGVASSSSTRLASAAQRSPSIPRSTSSRSSLRVRNTVSAKLPDPG